MPCPTATRDVLDALMQLVEADPSTHLSIDLTNMRVSAGGRAFEVSLPAGTRDAFLNGGWDATGLLLEDFEQVRAVAARLPYVTSNW
jgi:3-isopropylmalate/(R)-2-methylmalate dehydratase small subunit